ncbi:hypothetical protein SAMN05444405_10673 [Bacteroides luti]|jgi:hypothetical protein|uniref:Uncharacterized protein n=1 Tax=Bacteroides luti TaxID=1297750 RepID=A0A1M4ZW56_9BACE|nr:hypothetical protein [Bacteroides luti]SHF22248.1 hypothetical protein SAMN05444405_10673 [Bacteroides luti]
MPEYFDISLIVSKRNNSKNEIHDFLMKINLPEGENESEYFENRKTIVSLFDYENADFYEICVGIPEQTYHKEVFENELMQLTSFIHECFEQNSFIKYALCSFELNGYLLKKITNIQDFDCNLLNRFPIVYCQDEISNSPLLFVNLSAQDIFV